MDLKFCLCLFLLGSSWCCTARKLAACNPLITETEDVSVLQINNLEEPRQAQPLEEVNGNEQLCTFCEEYAAKAVNYMANNRTEREIIDHLHKSCLKLRFYKECSILVDYYAPLFFLEINKIRPEDFCQKFGLCERDVANSQVFSEKNCNLCHQVVTEAEKKLKDPDTQLEILELLKACGALKPYAKKFLEKNDICAILHACEPAVDKEQPSLRKQTSSHSLS
ncbi:uncharacterized protein LOC132630987 [Lycium barbarum]|uniref:uncharacterized protein LOC132630987 n=1 Tax=Lycium barbarum TaxID=112863 RepID=UPI00293E4025|nr:uncharacterized protein LOC132630987 [Lycium barbarum]XP_060202564.1 uncharacterized protein LOC132630987 [Lycium barbarum]XP_060202565.1 uncharacterized protein LOC132630987 [Lycium barbarum]